jgi:2-hydroxy-3-keto-5-methylthiopentenyl-1-phosphate phosphatase
MNDKYSVFIDFDGTITKNDVGYEMFRKFTHAATEPMVQQYREGILNSHDCLSGECDIWNKYSPAINEVYAYLDNQELAPGFKEFLAYLSSNNLTPTILSEGFSFYIDKFLSSHNLSQLERITNLATFIDGKLTPNFPYYKLGCDQCSNCKGYHIRRLRPPYSSAIYIGDGHSDLHGSLAADIVFASSFLIEILEESKKYFIPYENFRDIVDQLKTIFERQIFAQSPRIALCRIDQARQKHFESLWESGEVMRFAGYPSGLGWTRARYDQYWKAKENDKRSIHLALENSAGLFMGEAFMAFPNDNAECHHDLKLLPQFWGQGLAFEAWNIILEKAKSRWPDSTSVVTPSIENKRAIKLYSKLGFQFDSEIELYTPPKDNFNAVPLYFRKMIKRHN